MSKRLVILAPNWLGDAVMALPAIADLRRAMPEATITVAARPSVAPLFALVDAVNGCIDRTQIGGADIALLLPNAFRTALLAWRAGVPERWGYRTDGRGLLLTRGVDRPGESVHQIDYYRHLIAGLGFATGAEPPRVTVGDGARETARALLTTNGWDGRSPLVAIAPGAAYGGAKRWPAEHFAGLAASLARDGVQTVAVGTQADRTGAARAFQASGIDLAGKTDLPTLAGVFTHCRTLVTNDSGAMHLAAAVGLAVTAVFGPTRDAETRPRGDAHAVITNPVWCRPCMLRECPLDHRCLRDIDAAAVVAAARRTL